MFILIGQGRTADVFQYGENKVIKMFHKEHSHLVCDEYNIVKEIEKTGLLAPRAYEITNIDGKCAIVYDCVRGTSMLSLMQMEPLKLKEYAKKLAVMHAEMHKQSVPGLPNLKKSLHMTISSLDTIEEYQKEVILKYLDALPDGNSLCHYDFHPGNVLVENDEATIIDWMTAMHGDPCADVCRTIMILRSNVQPYDTTTPERMMLGVFRKLFYKIYIKEYLSVTGGTMNNIEQWLLPIAAARMAENIEEEKSHLNRIIKHELKAKGINKTKESHGEKVISKNK